MVDYSLTVSGPVFVDHIEGIVLQQLAHLGTEGLRIVGSIPVKRGEVRGFIEDILPDFLEILIRRDGQKAPGAGHRIG
jgi:hypothetical protein